MPPATGSSWTSCGARDAPRGRYGHDCGRHPLRLLITGTEGYIGCLLAPMMVARGYDVTGLDTGYFTDAELGGQPERPYAVITKDLRHLSTRDLEGFDAVMHLAGLSNDALGELSSKVTHAINHHASMRLALLAKAAGVTRYLYSSSCSVYGRSNEAVVTEKSKLDPQTDYALCKMLDERDIAELADDKFSPTFLRNGTAYGASPRMRFDLAVNNLAGLAWTTRRIAMISDGTPWRPIVHVMDICKALWCALEAPRETVHNEVFNVGRTEENYQIREIATRLSEIFPGCEVSFGKSDPDQRSYRVSFEKVHRALPGFSCDWDLTKGGTQLRDLFERVQLTHEQFRFRAFTRLSQLKHLIDIGQLDDDFFWTRQ